MAQSHTTATVLLVSIQLQPFFDDEYAPLIKALQNKAKVQRATNGSDVIRKLNNPNNTPPLAVLITDAALVHKAGHYAPVWDAILAYVRRGGTTVVMGHFSTFAHLHRMGRFFQKAGLPWEAGDYHRTQTVLNRSAVPEAAAQLLPRGYSQKALSIDNVAPGDLWYGSAPDSVAQSAVFAPDSAHRPGQAAAALARVVEGRLGYLGDVNAEAESNAVILAMCGLL